MELIHWSVFYLHTQTFISHYCYLGQFVAQRFRRFDANTTMATRRSSYGSNLRTPQTIFVRKVINIFKDNDEKTTEMIELLAAIDRLRMDYKHVHSIAWGLFKEHHELLQGYSALLPRGNNVKPDHGMAFAYLKKVKERLDRQRFYSFLRIFSEFGTKKKNIIAIVEEVSVIFAGHPDLMEGFIDFLPNVWNR